MKMKTLMVLAFLVGMMMAGAVLDGSPALTFSRSAVAGPRCEACR